MPDIQLLDMNVQPRSIGRAVVLISTPSVWDGSSELVLEHLGDTEGDILVDPENQLSVLTLPELTGDIPHEAYLSGESVEVPIPFFAADPTIAKKVSPYNSQHAGLQRRIAVVPWTIVLMPEELFIRPDPVTGIPAPGIISFDTGTFLKDGNPLNVKEERLLGHTTWIWKAFWDRLNIPFVHPEGSKAVGQSTLRPMHAEFMPNGHHIWTRGNPFDFGIQIDGSS